MTSYVAKKIRLFRHDPQEPKTIVKKRSQGRMKNYPSCTDNRAWITEDEERRQYIIELINAPIKNGLSLGKYVPIEVLIDLLLAKKNEDLERCRKRVKELEWLLSEFEKMATDEQKRAMKNLKDKLSQPAGDYNVVSPPSSYFADETTPSSSRPASSRAGDFSSARSSRDGMTTGDESARARTESTPRTHSPMESPSRRTSVHTSLGERTPKDLSPTESTADQPTEALSQRSIARGAEAPSERDRSYPSRKGDALSQRSTAPASEALTERGHSLASVKSDTLSRRSSPSKGGSTRVPLGADGGSSKLSRRGSTGADGGSSKLSRRGSPGADGGSSKLSRRGSPGAEGFDEDDKSDVEDGTDRDRDLKDEKEDKEKTEKESSCAKCKKKIQELLQPPQSRVPCDLAPPGSSRSTGQILREIAASKVGKVCDTIDQLHEEERAAIERKRRAKECDLANRGKLCAGKKKKQRTFEPEPEPDEWDLEEDRTNRDLDAIPEEIEPLNLGNLADNEDRDATIEELKKIIREKDAVIAQQKQIALEAIERLEALNATLNERNELKKKLVHSETMVMSLKKEKSMLAKSLLAQKPPELESLEADIRKLRSSKEWTPELETEIIKKELDVLKRYCDKLSNIQEENEVLKRELEMMKKGRPSPGSIGTAAGPSAAATAAPAETAPSPEMTKQVSELREELQNSRNRIKDLEKEIKSLKKEVMDAKEVQQVQDKSQEMKSIMAERDELKRKIDNMMLEESERKRATEDTIRKLRAKAAEADALEKEKNELLNEMQELEKIRRQSDYQMQDLHNVKSEKDQLNRALEMVGREKDEMQRRLEFAFSRIDTLTNEKDMIHNKLLDYEDEVEHLRFKAKEAEALRCERDRMLLRIEELQNLEVEVLTLVEQTKLSNRERDALKRRVCDLECIIADEEDEIARLVSRIDCLSQTSSKQHERLRAALEKKSIELAASHEQLQDVGKLKDNVREVEERMQKTIETLSSELDRKREKIIELEKKLCTCNDDNRQKDLIRQMSHQLNESLRENERLQSIIAKIPCVDKSKTEELSTNMTEQLNEARKEIERLQKLIKQLQESCQKDHLQNLVHESELALQAVLRQVEVDELQGSSHMCHQVVDLQKALDQARYEINRLQKKLDNAEETSQLDRLYAENSELRRQCSCLQEMANVKIEELTVQLNATVEENNNLKRKIEELKQIDRVLRSESMHMLKQHYQETNNATREMDALMNQLENVELANKCKCMEKDIKGLQEKLVQETKMRKEVETKLTHMKDMDETNTAALLSSVSNQFIEDKKSLMSENENLKQKIRCLKCNLGKMKKKLQGSGMAATPSTPLICTPRVCNKELQSDLDDSEQLRAVIQQLTNDIKDMTSDIERLTAENNYLKCYSKCGTADSDAEHLMEKIKELEQVSKILKSENEKVQIDRQEFVDLKEKYDKLMTLHTIEKTRIEEMEEEIRRLTAANSSTTALNEKHQSEKQYLAETIDQLEAVVQELKCENKCLRTCLTMAAGTEDVTIAYDESQSTMKDDLKRKNQELEEEIEKLRNELNSQAKGECLERKLRARIAELEDLLQKQTRASEAGENAERKLRSRTAELEDLLERQNRASVVASDEVSRLRARIKELETELEEQAAKIKTLQEERRFSVDSENKIASLENEKRALEERLEKMQKELDNLTDDRKATLRRHSLSESEKDASIINLQVKNQELEAIKSNLQKQLDECRNKIATASSELQDLRLSTINKEKHEQTMSQLNDLRSKNDELRREMRQSLEAGLAENNELRQKLEGAHSKLEHTRRQSEQLDMERQSQLQKLSQESEDLRSKLAERKVNDEGLTKQNEDLKKKLQEMTDQMRDCSILKEENDTLKKKIEEKNQEMADLLKSMEGDMRAETERCREELEKKNKEMADLLARMNSGSALHDGTDREKQDNEDLMNKIKELENQLNECLDSKSIKSSRASVSDTIRSLMKQLEEEQRKNQYLSEEIDRLRNSGIAPDSGDSNINELIAEERRKSEAKIKSMEEEFNKSKQLLKEQYDKDLQKVRGMHNESTRSLQTIHEETIDDLKKEHEEDMDNMQKQLAEALREVNKSKEILKETTKEYCSCGRLIMKPRPSRPKLEMKTGLITQIRCPCGIVPLRPDILSRNTTMVTSIDPLIKSKESQGNDPAIDHLLSKALNMGMENMTLDEMTELHNHICNITVDVHGPKSHAGTDKLSLMRRIASLENDLQKRQRISQEKVGMLEAAMKGERQRLNELKNALVTERERNKELVTRMGSQTREVASIEVERDLLRRQSSYHEDKVQKLIASIEEEKARVRMLEDELVNERSNMKMLRSLLESEKQRSRTIKQRANQTIESMKLQLQRVLKSETQVFPRRGGGQNLCSGCLSSCAEEGDSPRKRYPERDRRSPSKGKKCEDVCKTDR